MFCVSRFVREIRKIRWRFSDGVEIHIQIHFLSHGSDIHMYHNTVTYFIYVRGSIHNLRDWCYRMFSSRSSAMQRYMTVLAYPGSQCRKFRAAGCTCFALESYLAWCDFAMDRTKEQRLCINFFYKTWTFLSRVITGYETTDSCITTAHRLTLPFSPGSFWPKTTRLSPPTHPNFLFPRLKVKLKGGNFDNWADRGRIAGGAEHPHRTRLPGCI
jgi:hypothetical protein